MVDRELQEKCIPFFKEIKMEDLPNFQVDGGQFREMEDN